MDNNKIIRIKDIAEMAGVSVGTVDRVIHKRGNVSEKAFQKVQEILEQIEYQPNLLARTLGANKKQHIVALLPNPEQDEYWWLSKTGVEQTMTRWAHFGLHISTLYFDLYDPKSFTAAADAVLETKPDAVLTAPIFYRESQILFQKLDESKIPYILFNTPVSGSNAKCFIGQNLYESGRVAAELLCIGTTDATNLAVLHVFEDIGNSIHLKEKEIGVANYLEETAGNSSYVITMNISNPEDPNFEGEFLDMIDKKSVSGILVTTSKGVSLVASLLQKHQLDQVRLVGYDLLKTNIQLLEQGRIHFLINQNPDKQAQLGIDYLAQLLLYDDHLPEENLFPLEIITRQNLKSYLKNPQNILNPQVMQP